MENMEKNTLDAERTFTQDEVNKIVQERLSRERAKVENGDTVSADRIHALEDREKQLQQREMEFQAKEIEHYMDSNGYPAELLDIIRYSDFKTLEENLNKLAEHRDTFSRAYEKKNGVQRAYFTKHIKSTGGSDYDPVGKAFKL